ncbi:unnamed protein product [Trichobilharzia szidati]|nr:unnamed protein product [Trichobilharzia szidati]
MYINLSSVITCSHFAFSIVIDCAVVCWIRCFFVTCWTESWTHISGLYTCGGNSNSCVGYAHASIESVGGDSV